MRTRTLLLLVFGFSLSLSVYFAGWKALLLFVALLVLMYVKFKRGGVGLVLPFDPSGYILPLPPSSILPASGGPPSLPHKSGEAVFFEVRGVHNFRELGGYPTKTGGVGNSRMKRFMVYRCGEFGHLSKEGSEFMSNDLAIKTIVDFRSPSERKRTPMRSIPSSVVHDLHLPIYNDQNRFRRTFAFLTTLFFNRTAIPELYHDLYRVFLDGGASNYGSFLKLFANEANYPIVFHCSAGKDRTGLGAALLLHILGVPYDTILADYSQSTHCYSAYMKYYLKGRTFLVNSKWGIPAEELSTMFMVDPSWLDFSFKYLCDNYGSVSKYILSTGVTEEDLDRIRVNLLS